MTFQLESIATTVLFFEVPAAVGCFRGMDNTTDTRSVRDATPSECLFSRAAGSLLLLVSMISLIINTRALFTTNKNQRLSRRNRDLVMGMFISSLCVIIISVPSVVAQCFVCRRLCVPIICTLEGFNSFFNGCAAMYMLVALSILRFATTANSFMSIELQRRFEKNGRYLVMICFLMGGVWSVPPLFGRMSAYAPEGLGFHCGLDWFDRTILGRVYFLALFIGVFFLPIILIVFVNAYIQRTIYRLTHLKPSVLLELSPMRGDGPMRRHVSDDQYEREVRRLRLLQEDRRFVVATGISVIVYCIAWTPYSVVAITQVFGEQFSLYNPWLMTTCAVLAKLAMITNPIIYTIILESHAETPKTQI